MSAQRARARVSIATAFSLLAACETPAPPDAAVSPPQVPAEASPYALPGPVTEPVLFAPEVISTSEFESDASFTPDGHAVYFVRSDTRQGRWTIFESRFVEGRWSTPSIAPFSGKYRDSDPFVTTDGEHLYFVSDRPVNGVAKADMDIWVMDRTAQGWSEPRNPGAPVNSAQSEWHPSMTARGTLYFGSSRPGGLGLTDLYRATSGGGEWHVENLGAPVNSASDEYEPLIAPDESYLVFMAYRPDSLGGSDLYVSLRRGEAWSEPRNLGPAVNSAAIEMSPERSPDGRYLFFSSSRPRNTAVRTRGVATPGDGRGDLYQMDLAAALGAAPAQDFPAKMR
jgi:Tol biopolymer transport system component